MGDWVLHSAPFYLNSLIQDYNSSQQVRSANKRRLLVFALHSKGSQSKIFSGPNDGETNYLSFLAQQPHSQHKKNNFQNFFIIIYIIIKKPFLHYLYYQCVFTATFTTATNASQPFSHPLSESSSEVHTHFFGLET